MAASTASDPGPQPVALRVRDLSASRAFFEGLFGLQPASDHPMTDSAVVLVSPVPGRRHFGIKLTTEPVPVRLSGVHVQLDSANDLLDLYFLALLAGVQTSELRFRHGSLATTITDPDGYLIEVETRHEYRRITGASTTARERGVPGRDAQGSCRGEQSSRSAADERPRTHAGHDYARG